MDIFWNYTLLLLLLKLMLLFVGSGGTYDTSKEDEVKKVRRSHLVQSVFILHLRNERATEAI